MDHTSFRRASSAPCPELKQATATIVAYRRLLAQASLAFFELDSLGLVTAWNGFAAEVFGLREQDAVGQYLEDIVGDRYRARVTHALSRAQRPGAEPWLGQLRLAGRAASESAEVSFKTVTFQNSQGQFSGAAGLAIVAEGAASAPKALPAPVGGVSAWRCTLGAVGALPQQFEMRQLEMSFRDAPYNDESFEREVERAVKVSAKGAVSSGSSKAVAGMAQPFECERLLPFESLSGGTRYYSVRGVASRGPEMPFGDGIEVAEGYVVDVTTMKTEQQDLAKWLERWRGLSMVAFNFMLLVDITEYRVLKAWGDMSALGPAGARAEGRALFDLVPSEHRSKHVDAFSRAMSTPGGVHVQELPFKRSSEQGQQVAAQCGILSDSSDPSIIFLGARLHRGGAGGELLPAPLAAPSGDAAGQAEGGAQPAMSSAPVRPGPRLSATTLGLIAGYPSPPPPDMSRREAMLQDRHAKAMPLPRMSMPRVPPAAPAAEAASKPPPAAVGGAVSPAGAGRCEPGRRKRRSAAGSSNSSRGGSPPVPRVLPTILILEDDGGMELWRSSELLLSEGMRAKELLTRDSAPRFNMPQQFADAMLNDSHELFVLDAGTGESLQIADLASTSLSSLQRHCNGSGQLTLVISPVEGSEDAFETIPQRS